MPESSFFRKIILYFVLVLATCNAFLSESHKFVKKHGICVHAEPNNKKTLEPADALIMLEQAEKLRKEAECIRQELDTAEKERRRKNIENVDRWLDELLIQVRIDDNTEMLNTEEQVVELIKEKRFGAEHINKIFDRICETSSKQSIDNCSPMISLLLDAACKVDCMEREDNPNKRWNHRVERDLRKKLFAMGWGINLDDVKSRETTRSITGDKDYF